MILENNLDFFKKKEQENIISSIKSKLKNQIKNENYSSVNDITEFITLKNIIPNSSSKDSE